MKSNKRFVQQATKKAERNHDAHKIDYIQSNIPITSIREETILDSNFWTLYGTRIPDLILNPKNNPIILEHDTVKVHGELGYENMRTLNRNQDFTRAKRPFFVINQDLAKQLGLDEAKLSTYLYYHTLSQINCGVWE